MYTSDEDDKPNTIDVMHTETCICLQLVLHHVSVMARSVISVFYSVCIDLYYDEVQH